MSDNLAAAEARFNQVARNSSIMVMGTLGSRIFGFVRTAIFALIVRSSVAGDAFNQANNLPTAIYTLIATGVVTGVLIPQIAKAMKRPDGGEDFVNRLLTLSLLVVAVCAVVCTLAAPRLISLIVSGKASVAVPGYLHLAILLGYWCLPQIFFYGLYASLGQVLNARGHFAAYAWAPAWGNLVQIAGLIGFWVLWGYQPDPSQWSTAMVALLGASTTLGIAVQGLCLIWPLRREGFRFHPRFGWRGYGFGEVSRMTGWTFAAMLATFLQSQVVSWAANATRGGVADYAGNSTLQYATQLYILPHSLIMASIVTALFPGMAKAWADRDTRHQKNLLRQGLMTPSVLVIPASIAMIGLGMPLIRTVIPFLSPVETVNVWQVMAAYSIGIWAYGITALKQRYYFAKQDGWTNFWLVLVMVGVQLAASFLAVWVLPGRYGVIGIALGSTFGVMLAAGLFLWLARRELGPFGLRGIIWLWAKVTLASALAALAGWGTTRVLGNLWPSMHFGLVELVGGGIVFVLVFWVAAVVLRINQVTTLVHQAVDKVKHLLSRTRRRGNSPAAGVE